MERSVFSGMYEFCLGHTRSDRLIRSTVSQKLESQNMTLMAWLALGSIAAGPKTGMSMTEISQTLDVTLPQVTALVSDLEDRKLAKLKVMSADHRSRLATATAKGKRVLNKIEGMIQKEMYSLTKGIPPSQLREYTTVVQKFSERAAESD